MSTKIYFGYRVPTDHLYLAIEWFRISMWRKVVALAGPSITTHDDVKRWVENHAECGFHVWLDHEDSRALIILWGLPPFTQNLKPPRWIEEFSYWNNTDPPEGMRRGAGYRRWKARGEVWDRVALDNGRWDARLTHVVLSKDGYGENALAKECLAKYREAWGIKTSTLLSKQKLPR